MFREGACKICQYKMEHKIRAIMNKIDMEKGEIVLKLCTKKEGINFPIGEMIKVNWEKNEDN